ncbi:MAG TPA: lysozyme inhibitor LprI family protein [Alphaproteobacteria bacterium]|jgi:uncharacterized protein YecT (DUF1311 family)|nr:lysozyme inhibitor LprI family protein [Alphaproteobacteria bacterium]
MRIFTALALLATFGFMPAASAEDCGKAANQVEMNTCFGQAFKKTDADLNVVYKQVASRLKDNKEAAAQLIAAERAWVGFRDAQCAFEAINALGGSIYPTLVIQCRSRLTGKRIDDLKALLHCEEGELSCPVPPAD